jgi:acetyl esterase/lipase
VYLAASQAGRAALDAARAAFHLAPALGKPNARKAVIAGHSQGGHSTMAAAAELRGYAPKLEIRGFAANAPPANFRAGGNAVLRGTTGFGTFIAMRLWTWQRYYALGGEPIFREPYASQAEGWFSSECLFVGSNGKVDTALDAHWPSDASTVISDPYLGYAKTDQWPEAWARVLDASTPIPKDIPQPIVVFQGTKDTTVPQADTDAYVAQLRAAGIAIDYSVVEGGEHPNTSLSSFTVPQLANEAAVTWIRERLAN